MIKLNLLFIYIFMYSNTKTLQNKRTLYKQAFI